MALMRQTGRRRFAGERRSRTTLVLLVLTSITLVTLDVRGFAPVEWARGAVLSVVAPVGGFASGALRPVGDAWSGTFDQADLKRENDELRRRVEELQGGIAQGQAAQSELEKLKRSLDLPYAGTLQRVTAQVTSGAIADFDATVEIDKGSDAGLARGMPVVVDTGLVGTVASVAPGRAVVRLVTDRTMKVGVNVAGRAERGVAEGQGHGNVVRAGQFDLHSEVPPGALLLTAGTPGSLFPAGIPVGTVEHVAVDEGAQQQVADVRLATALDDLSFVTVLQYRSGG